MSKEDSKDKIIKAYMEHVLEHGKAPSSVYAFAKKLEIEEKAFYDHFASLHQIEGEVILQSFHRAHGALEADEEYKNYSAREKVLSFFYTWVEILKEYRSFIQVGQHHQHSKNPFSEFKILKPLKHPFKNYIKEVLEDGKISGEVTERKMIDELYDKGFWIGLNLVFKYWIEDESAGFEDTDVAIEKSVNTAFEFLGKSPLDSMIDFGKFIYHTRIS